MAACFLVLGDSRIVVLLIHENFPCKQVIGIVLAVSEELALQSSLILHQVPMEEDENSLQYWNISSEQTWDIYDRDEG